MKLTRRALFAGTGATLVAAALPFRATAQTTYTGFETAMQQAFQAWANRTRTTSEQGLATANAISAAFDYASASNRSWFASACIITARQGSIVKISDTLAVIGSIDGTRFGVCLPIEVVADQPTPPSGAVYDGSQIGPNKIIMFGTESSPTYMTEMIIPSGTAVPTGWLSKSMGYTDSSYKQRWYRLTFQGTRLSNGKMPPRARCILGPTLTEAQIMAIVEA